MQSTLAGLTRFSCWIFAALALASVAPAQAQGSLQAGRDYQVVKPAQPTEAAGKIEVVEFFSYACPHCNDFDPLLTDWAKKAPKDVVLHRIPITFGRPEWMPLAKIYYTLEAMGELPRVHPLVFQAIHRDNLSFTDENTLFDWVAKQNLDRKKFVELYKSFSIQSKATRAQQIAAAYKIQGVPALAIDGKYLAGGSNVTSHTQMLSLVDQLIARARSEQGKK